MSLSERLAPRNSGYQALSTTTRVVHDSRAQRTTLPSIFLRRLFLDAASPLRRHPDARPACFCTPSWSSAAWWPDELKIANGFSGRDGTCDRRGSSGFPPAETRWDLYPPSLERARARQGSTFPGSMRPTPSPTTLDSNTLRSRSLSASSARYKLLRPAKQRSRFLTLPEPSLTESYLSGPWLTHAVYYMCLWLLVSQTRTNFHKIHGQVDLLGVCSARLPHAFRRKCLRLKSISEWHDGMPCALRAGDVFLLDEISLADDSLRQRRANETRVSEYRSLVRLSLPPGKLQDREAALQLTMGPAFDDFDKWEASLLAKVWDQHLILFRPGRA
ncbi:hypothetical protein C8R47DRAFT_1079069 [Mycena vitilis]|nr:hypothetical protein C8R47DRAFT_1079069 [Mycena vitilis]